MKLQNDTRNSIRQRMEGHKDIITNGESYKSAEINFIRALSALTAFDITHLFSFSVGDRLLYAELLAVSFKLNRKNWENLAAVALYYIHIMNKSIFLNISNYNHIVHKLKAAIPNFTKEVTILAHFQKSEIYTKLQEMGEIHDAMENIPWDDYKMELKYINWFLSSTYLIE